MWERRKTQSISGQFGFFRKRLTKLEDNQVLSLAKDLEGDIKQIKEGCYRMAWYMRGGVTVDQLMYNTDLEDQEIMSHIIKENIENTKTAKMPLL